MGWAFQNYCYADEPALADAINSSGLYPQMAGRIADSQFYWFKDVAPVASEDGTLSMRVWSWNATNAAVRFTFSQTYPVCTDVGPINSSALTFDEVPLYAGVMLPVFITAYLIRKFRSVVSGR